MRSYKDLANNINRTAKLAYYTARKRKGDVSELYDYSPSHLYRVLNGRRKINDDIANDLLYISYGREKNSVIEGQ